MVAGKQDVRLIRQKFHLGSILMHENCNMGQLTLRKLLALSIPHFLGNTFVVKTHSGPSRSLHYLMTLRIAKATYIFRDPRDVAISAFEHGQKLHSEGQTHTFAKISDVEEAILFAKGLLCTWNAWMKYDNVFHVRYEDLLIDPERVLIHFADFLSVNVLPQQVHDVVLRYGPQSMDDHKKGVLHFNKGTVGRFRDVITRKQLDLCNEYFANYLERMGYPI